VITTAEICEELIMSNHSLASWHCNKYTIYWIRRKKQKW